MIKGIKTWPVPQSYSKSLPKPNEDGAFGAPRVYKNGKGKHAGIDIYAPVGSKVVAIEDGTVVHVSNFTGAPWSPQWRKTWYVMVEHADKNISVYGEIRKPRLKKGNKVKSGQVIGYIAKVLFGKKTRKSAMLHFELHNNGSRISTDWYGKKPDKILNPTRYLQKIVAYDF